MKVIIFANLFTIRYTYTCTQIRTHTHAGHRHITLAAKRKITERQRAKRGADIRSGTGHVSQQRPHTASVGTQTAATSGWTDPSPAQEAHDRLVNTATRAAGVHPLATPITPMGAGPTDNVSSRSPLLPREPIAVPISEKDMLSVTRENGVSAASSPRDTPTTVTPLQPRRATLSPVRAMYYPTTRLRIQSDVTTILYSDEDSELEIRKCPQKVRYLYGDIVI